MRSALYEWPFTMHLLWEFRCIIDVLLDGIMGLMVAEDFATITSSTLQLAFLPAAACVRIYSDGVQSKLKQKLPTINGVASLPVFSRTVASSFMSVFGSRPSDHYFRSVCWFICLSVCLFVCLCRVFLSRLWLDFDQTWTYVICLGLVVSPRI